MLTTTDTDLVPPGRIVHQKQVAIYIPREDWKSLRIAAAFQHIPMTELVRRWMEPHLAELRLNPMADNDSDG